jgi:hypothetical protein
MLDEDSAWCCIQAFKEAELEKWTDLVFGLDCKLSKEDFIK